MSQRIGENPLVSVIIPAFNAAEWITESVQSLISQEWTNLEIIVVDDGSTDATADRVQEVSDARVRIIRQRNLGAAAARNRGLAESQGELIQYLDADDLLAPSKIRLQIEALRNAEPDAVASCAWYPFVDDRLSTRSEEPVWRERDPVNWLVRSLSGEGMMQPAGWLIPRPISDRAGAWNESLTLHDDAEYFTRILVNASVNVFVEGPVVYYRSTPGSLSRRRDRRAALSSIKVCTLRQETLLSARDDYAARAGLATRYAQFAYEFIGSHPDLAHDALGHIEDLDAKPANTIGGPAFRAICRTADFRTALKMRSLVANTLGGPLHND